MMFINNGVDCPTSAPQLFLRSLLFFFLSFFTSSFMRRHIYFDSMMLESAFEGPAQNKTRLFVCLSCVSEAQVQVERVQAQPPLLKSHSAGVTGGGGSIPPLLFPDFPLSVFLQMLECALLVSVPLNPGPSLQPRAHRAHFSSRVICRSEEA